MVYRNEISDTDWLKHVLIESTVELSQTHKSIDRSAAKKANNGYQGEFCLDQFSVQMITAATFITCLS